MSIWLYCKRCGRIFHTIPNLNEKIIHETCDVCNLLMTLIPNEYIDDDWITKDMQNILRKKLVETSEEFDLKLYANRDKIMQQKSTEVNQAMAIAFPSKGNGGSYQKTNVPECPTCHSKNIRKIGGVERGASIAAFGIFSKKINKSFKCGNCGYTW